MRNLSTIALLCGVLTGCTTPVASQSEAGMPALVTPATDVPPCRTVTGTADIDGTPQQISGLACRQSDGSWQIVQGDNDTLVYPVAWTDYYGAPFYGDWPPFFGGASVIFVDHFHHFHHMGHVHEGGPGMHGGMHAGFHGGGHGDFHGSGFGGVHSGTVWSGSGSAGGMGGGHRH